MKLPALPAFAALRQQWASLDERNRGIFILLACFAMSFILAFAVYMPLERNRTRTADRISGLEAARLVMLAQAEDVKRLRAQPPTQATAKLADQNSLRTTFAGAEVTAIGAGRYRVLINDGRFGSWLASLRTLNGALVVGELSVTRLPGPGERVRIEAVLQPPGAAPKAGAGS